MLWNETPQGRWQALMDEACAPFQQSWTYGAAASALGATVLRLELRENGRTLALAQGIARWFLRPVTLFTMGPVWIGAEDEDQQGQIVQHLRDALPGSLIATPPDPLYRPACEHAGLTDVVTAATLATLKLDPGLRVRMHLKWRNRLKAAEGSGLRVQRSRDRSTLDWLLDKDRQQQRTRGYRSLPRSFTRAWHELDPGNTVLMIASENGTPVAAMLFLCHGSTATYHIGWSGDTGRARNAHNLILVNAAKNLAETGVKRLNLGLIDTENAPGVARFKLGAGALPQQTGGTWFGF